MESEFKPVSSLRQRLDSPSPEKRQLVERLRLNDLSAVPGVAPQRTAPLSSAQQRLWFLDRLTPNSAFYTIDLASRLDITVDVDAMRRALNEMVRRHEVLRSCFADLDGSPVQSIAPALELPCPVIDLRHLPAEAREAEAMRRAAADAQTPFDLSRAPLLRTSLIQLDDADFLFLLVIHHIVADGWSLQIFSHELSVLYAAFQRGEASPLPDLQFQFSDYVQWERDVLQAQATRQLAYWTRRLADLPVLTLPSDHPRPALPSRRGRRQLVTISQSITRRLEALAREERTTLYAAALTPFAILLHRYSGQDDLVIGTPVAGRFQTHTEGLIGCLMNTLAMRVDLSRNPTAREAIGRVRETVIEALAHQHIALETLVNELHIGRDLSRDPLFQVTFQLYQQPGQPGARAKPVMVQKGTTQMDLAIDLFQSQAGLSGTIEYSTDLFEPATIERMVGHYHTLVEDMLDDPDQPIAGLRMLTSSERRQVVDGWNDTPVAHAPAASVHDLVSQQAARTPAATAVLCDGDELTFEALERRSNQRANLLRERGVGRGMRVGLLLERSIDLPISLLAILKAGAAYVALDPSSPRDRLAFQIADSAPAAILTTGVLAARLTEDAHRLICLDIDSQATHQASALNPAAVVQAADPAYVVYTSGSTGLPKGVLVSHAALLNHMRWFQDAFPLAAPDRMLHKYSLGFDVAAVEILAPLMSGAAVVVAPPGAPLDIDALISLIVQHGVTAIDVVPSQLALLVEHPAFGDCRSLRRITCGGEVLSRALAERVLAALPVELHNIYGPTEATISATCWTCRLGELPSKLPIGRPVSNVRAYILDPQGSPVPIGVPGELAIGGAAVALGYLNAPELTAAKFVADPFDARPGARLYKTGDCARFLADGNIEFLGRLDSQLKIRGVRIEPGEVEAALALHPSIERCVVTVHPDGRGDPQLLAHVVSRRTPELWPSVGEHFLYDPLLYHAMTHDTRRNHKYRAAIDRLVRGKTVVDIGTGADVLLARYSVEAGARRVYAIEMLEESYRAARDRIAELALGDHIELLFGDSRDICLPEQVDVCVSELLGMIASSEGVGAILNDAQRFLKPGGVMIPASSATRIAAVSLPEQVRSAPCFTQVSGPYVHKVFERVGHSFDLRICIDGASRSWLLSEAGIFESLDFANPMSIDSRRALTLKVTRDGEVDGFLLWLTAETTADQVIDALEDDYHWLPVYFPVFTPPVPVSAGDTFELLCEVVPSMAALTPDYRLTGRLLRHDAPDLDVHYESAHTSTTFQGNGFYAALFADGYEQRFAEPSSRLDAQALKAYLADKLPDPMIPSHFTSIVSMPLTAAGKVDRQKLPTPERARSGARPAQRPRTELERAISEIWQDLLGLATVGVNDNFFDLGGHSLLVIRVQSRLREQLGHKLAVVDLFRYPTVAALAEHLGARAAGVGELAGQPA